MFKNLLFIEHQESTIFWVGSIEILNRRGGEVC